MQEVSALKQKCSLQENESVRLNQLLEIEKDTHTQAKEDLKALRLENKDLIAQKARDAALVAAAEDLRRQWETVQVCNTLATYVRGLLAAHRPGLWNV